MSLTSDKRDGVQDDGGDESAGSRTSDGDNGTFICVVCQQPVAEETSQRWQGEPVHVECGAELRCGVSVGKRFDA